VRFVCFQHYRRRGLGVLDAEGRIIDLSAAAAAWLCLEQADPHWEREVALRLPADLTRYLAGGLPSRDLAAAAVSFAARSATGIESEPLVLERTDVRLLQPIVPPLLLSRGAVFREDVARDAERLEHREFFMRNPLNGLDPGQRLHLPEWLGDDFEIAPRLAVVTGAPLRRASSTEAAAAVFGYCPALEVCARDLEVISWAGPMFHLQYPHSRAFDGSLLLGDSVVSADEIANVGTMTGQLFIDGVWVFEGSVMEPWSELIDWLCELSEVVTLRPGTILIPRARATPVIQRAHRTERPAELVARPSQCRLLKSGASVVLEVEGVGTLETRIAQRAGD
jgi:acylpyruvate hydrolase